MSQIPTNTQVTLTFLFLALSPGLLLTIDTTGIGFINGKTSLGAIVIHAIVFIIACFIIRETSNDNAIDKNLNATRVAVATWLFIALSPGLFLTLPPVAGSGVFRSGETSVKSTLLHTAVFFRIHPIMYNLLYKE